MMREAAKPKAPSAKLPAPKEVRDLKCSSPTVRLSPFASLDRLAEEEPEGGSARSACHRAVGHATAAAHEPLDNLIPAQGPDESGGIESSAIRSPTVAFTLPQMAVAPISIALVNLPRSLGERSVEFIR
ncbi:MULTISPECIES: hypothetical protein [unclassified Paraburkholderia]|uniref:hypothetical protein n=1 Tax=unclassified Paraburkholderia TaxID=2615204 RepID=UPI0016074E1F|nr:MULTISPECIES: hypothetical protein [unclassified Paraburkholderia]MBB5442451.1 hypothetical protein [Paraburkholderia sp. WSM4177]MBB5482741.1 hypothetical protein [Paraburkholderia sp. WSM4180]